jgi:hypothetical protein
MLSPYTKESRNRFFISLVSFHLSAIIKISITNNTCRVYTSAIIACDQNVYEKASIRDETAETIGYLVSFSRTQYKSAHAAEAKIADIKFTLYATEPIGRKVNSLPIIVYMGYPVGWAIPRKLEMMINSPESPQLTVGHKVHRYTESGTINIRMPISNFILFEFITVPRFNMFILI